VSREYGWRNSGVLLASAVGGKKFGAGGHKEGSLFHADQSRGTGSGGREGGNIKDQKSNSDGHFKELVMGGKTRLVSSLTTGTKGV